VTDGKPFRKDPLRLIGSRDAQTGQVYFPPRPLAVDGSLRATEEIELSPQGSLYSWTQFAGAFYGQIDLPEGVRIQCIIDDEAPEIGATYKVVTVTDPSGDETWRFARV